MPWQDLENLAADDDLYAMAAAVPSGGFTEALELTDLGLAVPAGSVIQGVEVAIQGRAFFGTSFADDHLRLIKAGQVQGDNKAKFTPHWHTNESTKSYGSSGDLWGLSLTAEDVNAADFGLSLRWARSGANSADGLIDLVEVTVHYAPAPPAGGNQPPTLAAIGDQTIDLGTSLTLQLAASDPDGDPLTYSASPLPLPAGAALDGMTGLFTWRPDGSQVGDQALTFAVSDGLASDSEAVTLTVTGPPPGGVTALSGRVLDTNAYVATGQEIGVEGAVVSLLGAPTITATTDANGDFILSGIPSGPQVFDIDASNAFSTVPGVTYAHIRELLDLLADVETVVARPFYLPRIDPAGETTIVAGQATLVENVPLGVSMTIPADAAMMEGLPYSGPISISEVPGQLAPVALPEDLQPSLLITIQPTGVTFNQPIPITFPNSDGFAENNQVDLHSVNPATGLFEVVGTNSVDGGAASLTTTSGGVNEAGWHFLLPLGVPGGLADNNGTNKNTDLCANCQGNSAIRLQDGDLAESHATVTYRSFNRDRGLTFTYHSTAADPRPVVMASASIPDFMPIPSRLSTRLRIGGSLVNEEVFTGLAGLDDDVSEELHFASQFDAAAFATGSYPYEFLLKSDYRGVVLSGAQVTRRSVGRLFLRNEIASPFGAGWGLEGLERLSEQFDKAQLLLKGGGTTQLFEPETENDTLFTNPEILSGVPGARHHAIGDLNGDGAPEIAAPTPTGGGTVVFWNDGSGRFLSSSFVATAGSAVASRIADFNNDGHGDIVTGHSNAAGQFMVHIGDGAGGFTLWATVPVGLPMSETQVGDFDGDGFMDVIFASSPSGDDFLRIYYGDGSGGFTNDYGRSFGGFSRAGLAVGDINGDGLDDWALGYNLGNTTTYGLSNGPARTFSVSFTNADANGARDGTNAISDMNQDGFGELLSGDEAARFQQNVGNATGFVSRLAQSHALITNLRALAVGDLNGDGFKDVATTRGSGLSGVQIRFGRGNLSYEPALLVETGPNPGRSIAIGDLDGDGIDDIVLNDPVAGGLIVLRAVDPDAFASPAGEFSTLARNPDGSFTRRTKDGTLHDYDPEACSRPSPTGTATPRSTPTTPWDASRPSLTRPGW